MDQPRRQRNRPRMFARPPVDRHFLNRIKGNSFAKAKNSVILPDVNVADDVEAINAGAAIRDGDRFIIKGRTYGQKESGPLYPISGHGIVTLDRWEMQAIMILARYNGNVDTALYEMQRNPMITGDVQQTALALWKRRTK